MSRPARVNDLPPPGDGRHIAPVARLALVGAGAIASDHAAAIAATRGLRLVLVVDRHPERASALAALYGADTSADMGALHGAGVDAVVVCTSPESHVAIAVDALEAGKGVLVEKPAALSLDGVDRLLEAATRAGRPLLVGQTARFQPANHGLAGAVAAGRVGRPRLVHITWYSGHVWPGGWRAWQLDAGRSGGHLIHNGVHAFDLAVWLLRDVPLRVYARPLRTWAAEMPTSDSFHILAEFAGGGLAVIELSYALRERGGLLRRVLVAGTEGTVVVDSQDEPESAGSPRPPLSGVAGAMRLQYSHFSDVLRRRVAPITTPEQIRAAVAGAVAAQRSADTGEIISTEVIR